MTRDAQLAALERLMDDPSPVVRKAVLKGVQAAGTEGLLWLQQLSKDQNLGPHALATARGAADARDLGPSP